MKLLASAFMFFSVAAVSAPVAIPQQVAAPAPPTVASQVAADKETPTQERPRIAYKSGVATAFRSSDRCLACHVGMKTSTGEDYSIGFDWRASLMANSSRDPYWQSSIRRETVDHAEAKQHIENDCSACPIGMQGAILMCSRACLSRKRLARPQNCSASRRTASPARYATR
jgi:hypothetical protein